MNKISFGKAVAGIGVVAALGVVIAAAGGFFNKGFTDGGIDVRNTACEQIASARQAVNDELTDRKNSANQTLGAEMEAASDAFWTENRRLEDAHHACMSGAVSADPCKPAFERIGQLYEEIMAQLESDGGFNEAKFEEREQAKKEYEECVEKARSDEFYKADKAQCDTELAAGQQANQEARTAAETAAQSKYQEAVTSAENAAKEKQAILDAIEEKCNEPADTTNLGVGGLTTQGTGTDIKATNSACTGIFEGNDPELKKTLSTLESQLQKAKAAGLRDGLYGIDHLQQAVNEARQELKDSQRSCVTDADCGDVEPVCCSGNTVGRAFCDGGVCANEITECEDPEICAGKPAQCVAPTTGAQQQEGIYISRTIPEVGACSQNLQVLNLQKATAESARYEITGNIPNWVNIDKPGGSLPASVNVSYSCNTVQGFGPGTYDANGSITVYNAAGELINTIPFNISITVEKVAGEELIEVIGYNGKYIPLSQVRSGIGSECDEEEHWHANGASVTATDGTVIADPAPNDCGFGKTKNVPVMKISVESDMQVEVRGLEGLRAN